ncbi:MAG: hypothetical protein HGB12_06790 [Bacteroidetes bacterium]|nr:hypothetical protein [Bacteroidota bacterium]
MKKLLIISVVAFFATASFGQTIEESQVPESVLNTLKVKYPNVKVTKWEKKDSIYTAELLMNQTATEVELNDKGTWKSTEWPVPVEYTPKKINDYISLNYIGYKINEVSISDFPVDGKMYITEISKKKDCEVLYFSLKGEFKKVVKETCNKNVEKKCCKKKKPCKKTDVENKK